MDRNTSIFERQSGYALEFTHYVRANLASVFTAFYVKRAFELGTPVEVLCKGHAFRPVSYSHGHGTDFAHHTLSYEVCISAR